MEALVVIFTVLAVIPLTLLIEFRGWYNKEIKLIGDTEEREKAEKSFSTVKDYLLSSILLYFITSFIEIARDYPQFLAPKPLPSIEIFSAFFASLLLVGAVMYWRVVDRSNDDWSRISPTPLGGLFMVVGLVAMNTLMFGYTLLHFFDVHLIGKIFGVILLVSYVGAGVSILKWQRVGDVNALFVTYLPWFTLFAGAIYAGLFNGGVLSLG